MSTNQLKPYWEEHGRPYRGEEFQFSETQIDAKTMAVVIKYIKMAMMLADAVVLHRLSKEGQNETRALEPYFKDLP